MTERNYAQQVAGEVRAEMARQDRSVASLADTLGLSRTTARSRYNGHTPFNLLEVAVVANWLGVSVDRLTSTPSARGAA